MQYAKFIDTLTQNYTSGEIARIAMIEIKGQRDCDVQIHLDRSIRSQIGLIKSCNLLAFRDDFQRPRLRN